MGEAEQIIDGIINGLSEEQAIEEVGIEDED